MKPERHAVSSPSYGLTQIQERPSRAVIERRRQRRRMWQRAAKGEERPAV